MIEKLKRMIRVAGERFFIDPETAGPVDHLKLSLLAVAYASGRNLLLTGEPGFGKTSAAKTMLSVCAGLPFDLFEASQIEGHPEQTRETLVGRPDFHKLATEGEVTIWNIGVFMPGLLVDEINRLPEGKQEVLLTCVDTGRFNSPLGHSVFTGKRAFFATANYRDNGDLGLAPAMLDRFDLSLEFGAVGPFYREKIATAATAREAIRQPQLVDRVLRGLQNREIDDAARFQCVAEARESFKPVCAACGFEPLDAAACTEWQQRVATMPFASDALLLLDCLESEMNFSPRYGLKRRSDPLDSSDHARSLACSRVYNALSPRALQAIELFSRALALLRGAEQVSKLDLATIVPLVLAHRLRPGEDFRAEYAEQTRHSGGSENQELATRLLQEVEKNFASVYEALTLLNAYRRGTLKGEADRTRVEALLRSDPEQIDHPLLRQYLNLAGKE